MRNTGRVLIMDGIDLLAIIGLTLLWISASSRWMRTPDGGTFELRLGIFPWLQFGFERQNELIQTWNLGLDPLRLAATVALTAIAIWILKRRTGSGPGFDQTSE